MHLSSRTALCTQATVARPQARIGRAISPRSFPGAVPREATHPHLATHRSTSSPRAPLQSNQDRSAVCHGAVVAHPNNRHNVQIEAEEGLVGPALCEVVAEAANRAIAARGCFAMAIPGGSVLSMLKGLSAHPAVDWGNAHIFYVNHKCVPMDDDLATHKKALAFFAEPLGIPSAQVYALGGSADANAEAKAYEESMRAAGTSVLPVSSEGLPVFDLVLVGMGSDGHIGSLYPGRPEPLASKEAGWCLGVTKSTPPPSITLTLPVINAASEVVCAMTGRDKKTGGTKAPAVARAIEGSDGPGEFPAQGLANARWILDELAAADLTLS